MVEARHRRWAFYVESVATLPEDIVFWFWMEDLLRCAVPGCWKWAYEVHRNKGRLTWGYCTRHMGAGQDTPPLDASEA
jgi:hypothetical protein